MTVAVSDQPRDQIITTCPLNRVFASSENFGNGDHIGLIKTGAKIFEQGMQARVAMGLMDGNHTAIGCLTRGLKHRGDFHGVVTVIINDGDAIHLTHFGKAAIDPFEVFKGGFNLGLFHAQMPRNRNRRQNV